ncbi:uncharacterized protein STEHIDRAFT_149511 [Stereum hirsutum FP-91666 SS1]|uniref:uncharacterized protein n=1 Tax=Stereum hirsutum (strain FP-91666) TaxID=721885 RepID=UPI000444A2D0|nr:uncharacterized protein STEHIDRAFT_149511 [Stereum hirsutum FP-91666 SS1]EIM82444.1 hypothetical protein STEHIDRAFT_149511 [Stereum hirsutum FP-91666 SS1]
MSSKTGTGAPLTTILDHIVHITPPGTVEKTAEQFRELGFHVSPGGTHVGGLTANTLVILPDGSYIELISFTQEPSYYPPESPEHKARLAHNWANKDHGWCAYAFLGAPSAVPAISTIINDRAKASGLEVRYAKEVSGGRTRGDGVELKWVITSPQEWAKKEGGTKLPFFCGDVTDRSLRVPTETTNTTHPNTAQSVAYLRLLSPVASFKTLSQELTAILGSPPTTTTPSEVTWQLHHPLKSFATSTSGPQLILTAAKDEDEAEQEFVRTHGPGLYEVAFRVADGKQRAIETPYGRIAWVS